jgi:hypothetical protein
MPLAGIDAGVEGGGEAGVEAGSEPGSEAAADSPAVGLESGDETSEGSDIDGGTPDGDLTESSLSDEASDALPE